MFYICSFVPFVYKIPLRTLILPPALATFMHTTKTFIPLASTIPPKVDSNEIPFREPSTTEWSVLYDRSLNAQIFFYLGRVQPNSNSLQVCDQPRTCLRPASDLSATRIAWWNLAF